MAEQHGGMEAAFAAVRKQWNKAERAIKLAEQVNEEIVNPAIYELRYSGRRIVEAFDLSASEQDAAINKLRDAEFDCCRARHDAIDAATSKMVAMLDAAQEKLGADLVLTHFAAFPNLVRRLGDVRDKIVVSREDRENRDKIYEAIEAEDLTELVSIYRDFKASEELLKQSAALNRQRIFWSYIFGFIGIISLILSIVFFLASY